MLDKNDNDKEIQKCENIVDSIIVIGTKVILKETGNVADRFGNLNQDNIKGVVKKIFKYTDSEYKYKVKTGQRIYRYCKLSDIQKIEVD